MPTRSIDIDKIKIGSRFRIGLGEGSDAPQRFDELKDSLSRNGMLNAIVVDENLELIAGFRRLTAARELGWETVDCHVRDDMSEYDKRVAELEENFHRLDMTWQEREIAIAEIDRLRSQTDPNWGQRQTAQMLGMDQSDISKAKSLTRGMELFPELRNAKSRTQALAWLSQKAKNVNRRFDVAGDKLNTYNRIQDRIVLGDSVELIRTLPDGIAHATITDPPFGIDYDERSSGTVGSTSSYRDDAEGYRRLLSMAPDIYRVTRPNGFLVWFLGISWYEEAKATFKRAGFTVDEIPIIWDRSDGHTFTSRPDRWFPRGYDIALHCVKGDAQLVQRGGSNVIHIPPVESKDRDLLVERPVELYAELIRRLTLPGELVLDFFVGSGSCPAACAALGRDYIGFELDPERHAKAVTKIHSYTPEET